MHAVVVYESCFGNTSAVAAAIADGLRDAGAEVDALPAESAPAAIAADLVLVGAPTHNMGLPTAASRRQAAAKGATVSLRGVREWIDGLRSVDGRVLTFGTTTGGAFAGSAGKAIVRALERAGVPAERGTDFRVTGTPGPLAAGQADEARAWGRSLGSAR